MRQGGRQISFTTKAPHGKKYEPRVQEEVSPEALILTLYLWVLCQSFWSFLILRYCCSCFPCLSAFFVTLELECNKKHVLSWLIDIYFPDCTCCICRLKEALSKTLNTLLDLLCLLLFVARLYRTPVSYVDWSTPSSVQSSISILTSTRSRNFGTSQRSTFHLKDGAILTPFRVSGYSYQVLRRSQEEHGQDFGKTILSRNHPLAPVALKSGIDRR